MDEDFEKALQRISDRSSTEGPVWMLGALVGPMISYFRTHSAGAIKVIIAFVAAISAFLFVASTVR